MLYGPVVVRSVRILYGRFAAAYGTCWLITVLLGLVSQTHINTGWVGLLGFPLVSAAYALLGVNGKPAELEHLRLKVSYLESRLAAHGNEPKGNPSALRQ